MIHSIISFQDRPTCASHQNGRRLLTSMAKACPAFICRHPGWVLALGLAVSLTSVAQRASGPEASSSESDTPIPLGVLQAPVAVTVPRAASAQNFALTFDDGPHPVHTSALLDWLKQNRIRATFFVLGQNAERYPDLVKRMVQEGHEVGNHSWSHPNLRLMSPAKMLAEVRRAHDLITRLTGRAPALFRPPYGALSASQRRLIEKEFRYQVVLWTVDTQDWKLRNATQVAAVLESGTRGGSIVLAHDIHDCILPALDQMLPVWKLRHLNPMPLSTR